LLVLRLRGVDDVRRGLRELVLELLRDRAWKASSELLREILALLLGVVESLTSTFYGPSWAPAVSFALLLLVLGVRPQGLFGR